MPKKRVLIVEDEWLLASNLEMELEAADFEPVGPAATITSALEHVDREKIDAAILDANVGGSAVDSVAASLQERRIPFMFFTGYSRNQLPEAFRQAPFLEKPATGSDVISTLRALFS